MAAQLNNVPQFNSSEPSKQSSVKSHCLDKGIHSPLPHCKVPSLQVTFSEMQEKTLKNRFIRQQLSF